MTKKEITLHKDLFETYKELLALVDEAVGEVVYFVEELKHYDLMNDARRKIFSTIEDNLFNASIKLQYEKLEHEDALRDAGIDFDGGNIRDEAREEEM